MPCSNTSRPRSTSIRPPQTPAGVRDVRLPEGGAGDISYPEDGIDLLQVHAEASWWIQHRVRHVAALLRDVGVRQLVDVGAGSGVMGERLGAEGIPTLSVEPHYSGAAGIARRGLDVFCGTLQQAAFPESSLPAVGLFDVIEHLPSPDALLREVRRVVADDGVVVVTVPAHSWLWGEEDDYAGHHRRYNRKRLVAEMAAAGLRAGVHVPPVRVPGAARAGRQAHPLSPRGAAGRGQDAGQPVEGPGTERARHEDLGVRVAPGGRGPASRSRCRWASA